ncbi:MAG: thioesterase II family protein [Thiolinea sp.]
MQNSLDYSDNPWLTNFNLKPHNRIRLFALPYSGAGAGMYFSWSKHFHANGIDLIAIQPPGREQRIHEKPITHLPDLVGEILNSIYPLTDQDFAFFGHSLGGLIAFELTQKLIKEGKKIPKHLFVSAFRSPDIPNPNPELHQLNDSVFLKKIAEYGGTPDTILKNNELMALLLPILRADFKLLETYRYQPTKPMSCPITLFNGEKDAIVKPVHMSNWRHHTNTRFRKVVFPGNHFFINDNRKEIISEITNQLHNEE